jgi:glycosyltransferase involved in cell wall biosynthesis
MKNKISVTIATYKRPVVLAEIINMLQNQTLDYTNYEVIICDSHSCSETAEMIKYVKKNNPKFDISHLHTRNVLAAKRNLGISSAKYSIVLFMDDDCIPSKSDFLERHLALFEDEDAAFLIMCGEVRFPQEWMKSSNYYRFRDEEGFYISNNEKVTLDFRTIVVMNMSFRRDKFLEKIGSVNEEFIGYGMEDQELGWRLQDSGFKICGMGATILHNELSAGIDGYGKKIYHTAKDGAATLLRVCPDAFSKIRVLRLIDKQYPFTSKIEMYFFNFARLLIFQSIFYKIARKFALMTDNMPALYFKFIYRYILACDYILGVRDRDKKIINPENGWYN